MMRYLARRAALMMVTLIGVTIIVFLLGRVLPGPMIRADDGGGIGGAAAVVEAQRWQDARYGLNRPLIQQYIMWWRGMVVVERDVLLWTDGSTPQAIFRIARNDRSEPEYVVRDRRDDVRGDDWRQFVVHSNAATNVQILSEEAMREFVQRLDWRDRARVLRDESNDHPALHASVQGTISDSVLDEVTARIERVSTRIERTELTLGSSRLTNTTVMTELRRRLPVTATIGVVAIGLMFGVGIFAGVLAGARVGRVLDRIVSGGALMVWSLPMVVGATVLYGIFNAGEWNSGYDDGADFGSWLMKHVGRLLLPAIVLALPGGAYIARQVRAAVAEQMQSDYVRTAMAKGCSGAGAVYRHALRPSMIVVVTMMGTILPVVIGGSVIVETVFGIDGMGRYICRAALARDYDVVQSMVLIAATANVVGLFIADILYVLIDPRIRFGAAES